MKILVASDLTARSDRALARAFLLARELSAGLDVLHVVDENLPGELRTHAAEWAASTLARETQPLAAACGVTPRLTVSVGNPRDEVVRRADPATVDLLLLGVHGGAASGGKRFGETTAGRILKSSLAAVLLVRDPAEEPYRRAVVGVDFSMYARLAIRQACLIAPAATLHLAHAYHVPFKGLLAGGDVAASRAYEQKLAFDAFLREEMAVLEQRAQDCRPVPGQVEKLLEAGEPRQVLRALCRRVAADLLVIGTHGRAGASRALWGSVAADLLEEPPCDLLVIKPY